MLLAILVLCALAVGWTVYPLLAGVVGPENGDGLESNSSVAVWKQEKDRLVAEMVALDIAFSEGRIDVSDHSEQRNRLMSEAEDAAARLGKSRSVEFCNRGTTAELSAAGNSIGFGAGRRSSIDLRVARPE